MNVYLDANVLVSLFIRDEMTPAAQSALRSLSGLVTVSDWTLAETASALSRAVRTQLLDYDDAWRAMAAIDRWTGRTAHRIEVLPADVREAERVIRNFDTVLKTPDALHIAVARRNDMALLTFDSAMGREARRLGVDVVEV